MPPVQVPPLGPMFVIGLGLGKHEGLTVGVGGLWQQTTEEEAAAAGQASAFLLLVIIDGQASSLCG
jgi:hypothetical protein